MIGLRHRSSATRELDGVVHGRGDRGLAGGTTHHPGWAAVLSALAITTALTLRAVFRLALRQTEGLIASILELLGLDLPGAGP